LAHIGTLAVLPVRLILGISLLLLGFGTLSCRVDVLSAQVPQPQTEFDWVRTADGWERLGSWQAESPPRPHVHPLVIAAGQLLGSVLALAAFQGDGPRTVSWKCC
jgi:hypothetical protein